MFSRHRYAANAHEGPAYVGLSEGLYLEMQRANLPIGVSVLCPGHVNTNIVRAQRNRPAELLDETPPPMSPAGHLSKIGKARGSWS